MTALVFTPLLASLPSYFFQSHLSPSDAKTALRRRQVPREIQSRSLQWLPSRSSELRRAEQVDDCLHGLQLFFGNVLPGGSPRQVQRL